MNLPAGADLPKALPSEMADKVAQGLRDLIDAQPNVPRSGDGEWVECDACRNEYGILECVEKAQMSDHKHDCHGVTACVICGCPVVRGDIVQWRKHRKSKCPPWRAMVKCGRHVEWLESNGLLDAGSKIYHRQFFDHDLRKEADAEADNAARRELLLDALKAKELAKLPAAVQSSEPFKGIVSKKVLMALQCEMEGESAAA